METIVRRRCCLMLSHKRESPTFDRKLFCRKFSYVHHLLDNFKFNDVLSTKINDFDCIAAHDLDGARDVVALLHSPQEERRTLGAQKVGLENTSTTSGIRQ